jgi:DNA (cytosine-5)-methyltransferase 1
MTRSTFTVTDLFCGAGGSSLGAAAVPGAELTHAANHWDRAIETIQSNHPDVDARKCDLVEIHPTVFPPMTVLTGSPECRTHSPANGQKRTNIEQFDLFDRCHLSPEKIKSRATMDTMLQWASVHRPEFVVVENVVEVLTKGFPIDRWRRDWDVLGYNRQEVYVNGAFVTPMLQHTEAGDRVDFWMPQDRDRVYFVFSKKGNPLPDVSIQPPAPCPKCLRMVDAVQTWKMTGFVQKHGRVGKYGRQYVYTCPECAVEVEPLSFAAVNCIDPSIESLRIGERESAGRKPLSDKTMRRIRHGLRKYGLRRTLISDRYSSGVDCRVRTEDRRLPTQPTQEAVAVVETAYSHSGDERHRDPHAERLGTQSTRLSSALVLANRTHGKARTPEGGRLPSVTTGETVGLVTACRSNGRTEPAEGARLPTLAAGGEHAALVTTHRGKSTAAPSSERSTTYTAHAINHGLVSPAAQVTLRGSRSLDGLDDRIGTVVASAQQTALLAAHPLLVNYYGTGTATSGAERMGTLTTRDRHALVESPDGRLIDPNGMTDDELDEVVRTLFFRMFDPEELKVGTGYPKSYELAGNRRDRVRLVGGSNFPGIEQLLVARCMASIA